MKKIFLIFTCFAMSVLACSKDEGGADTQIVGKWHRDRDIVYSGKDEKVLNVFQLDNCAQTQYYEFFADGKCTAEVPMEEDGKCNLYPMEITNYRYDPSAKIIEFIYNSGTEDEVKDGISIYKSSSTEMELVFSEEDADYDDDGIEDHYISVFRKN